METWKGHSPHKRAPRPTFGVERGTGCQLGRDVHSDNLNGARDQRLISATPAASQPAGIAGSHRIVINDAPVGYQVEIRPELDDRDWDHWFDDAEQDFARLYASGLAAGTGWPMEDISTPAACPVSTSFAEKGFYTTPDGALTVYEEHGTTVWNEEAFDPEFDVDETEIAA